MTLDQYLTDEGLTEAAFGARVRLSQSQINRLRTGVSWPPKSVAERIRAATGGKVTPDDFLAPAATREPHEGIATESAA